MIYLISLCLILITLCLIVLFLLFIAIDRRSLNITKYLKLINCVQRSFIPKKEEGGRVFDDYENYDRIGFDGKQENSRLVMKVTGWKGALSMPYRDSAETVEPNLEIYGKTRVRKGDLDLYIHKSVQIYVEDSDEDEWFNSPQQWHMIKDHIPQYNGNLKGVAKNYYEGNISPILICSRNTHKKLYEILLSMGNRSNAEITISVLLKHPDSEYIENFWDKEWRSRKAFIVSSWEVNYETWIEKGTYEENHWHDPCYNGFDRL